MAEDRKVGTNPLAEIDPDLLSNDYQRKSSDLIYDSIMRGGGVPFGPPFEVGTPTLTEKIVRLFKQKSFFAFETLEKVKKRGRKVNKFTRYGAARYRGELKKPAKQ